MKYKIIILLFLTVSCSQNFNNAKFKKTFNSKGFAYIYNTEDFENKIIQKSLNNNAFLIAHNKLKPGTLIKLINPYTNDSIILKNIKNISYPDFYKILITLPVAEKLKLNTDLPYIEVIEIKKNESFIAKKTQIYNEEKKIHSNAPVQKVQIDNISRKENKIKIIKNIKFYIHIADFYSKDSALILKKRITSDLKNFNINKLSIKTKKTNKIRLLSGPYTSINLLKNDYIQLKYIGFEELDIIINE